MNRDVILATCIGLGLGLIITGIVIVSPQLIKAIPSFKMPKVSLFTKPPRVTPAPTPTPEQFVLTIGSPLPDSIESDKNLVVSGTSTPGGVVVVTGNLDEDIVTTPADGKYAGKITLSEGKNEIVVTSYKNGRQKSQTVTVYFTPEDL